MSQQPSWQTQQPPYRLPSYNQPQWSQQPPPCNSHQPEQFHLPSCCNQQAQYHSGEFQLPLSPSYNVPPHKQNGLTQLFLTQIPWARIGLGCGVLIAILSLYSCSVATVGMKSTKSLASTSPSTPPTNQIMQISPQIKASETHLSQNVVENPGCGVTKNLDGSYHFSWLHVANGKVVDQNNCPVTLLGLNTAGFEFGDASGGDMTQSHIQQLSSRFNVDLWRLAINVSWWNNNNVVPSVNMHYQEWIKQQIQWMKQNGNYVEIDPTNYVTISPKYGVQYCSNESVNPPPDPNCIPAQDTLNNPPWTEHQMVDATVQFWNTVVPLYANDPAILYDPLNEPYPSNNPAITSFGHTREDLNQMINVIQRLNPKALVFVYGQGTDQIASGQAPDYPQTNLVWDFHPYDDSAWPWQQKLQYLQPVFRYAQAHNHAVSIGEWGDPQLANKKAYAAAIINLVKTQGFATSFYAENSMMSDAGKLTSVGTVVQAEYASLPRVH